jgi:hypothetical protein
VKKLWYYLEVQLKAGWAVALPNRREVLLMFTVYEGISLMIGFASLIVAVIAVGISSGKKK